MVTNQPKAKWRDRGNGRWWASVGPYIVEAISLRGRWDASAELNDADGDTPWSATGTIATPCDVVTLMLAAESALATHLRAVADTMTWPEAEVEADAITYDKLVRGAEIMKGVSPDSFRDWVNADSLYDKLEKLYPQAPSLCGHGCRAHSGSPSHDQCPQPAPMRVTREMAEQLLRENAVGYAKLPPPDPKFTKLVEGKTAEYKLVEGKTAEYTARARAVFGPGARTELYMSVSGYMVRCADCKGVTAHKADCSYRWPETRAEWDPKCSQCGLRLSSVVYHSLKECQIVQASRVRLCASHNPLCNGLCDRVACNAFAWQDGYHGHQAQAATTDGYQMLIDRSSGAYIVTRGQSEVAKGSNHAWVNNGCKLAREAAEAYERAKTRAIGLREERRMAATFLKS